MKQEIRYWDNRASVLKDEEKAGKKTRLNWQNAERRAEDLTDRLQRRLAVIADERAIAASPPNVNGGLLVIPQGLLDSMANGQPPTSEMQENPDSRKAIEDAAMNAVMEAEQALGYEPADVSLRSWDMTFYHMTQPHRKTGLLKRRAGQKMATPSPFRGMKSLLPLINLKTLF